MLQCETYEFHQIFLDEVDEKFNDDGEEGADDSITNVSTNVDNCEFIDVVDETGMTASLPSTMFLKLASPVNYTFTTEERKFLKMKGHVLKIIYEEFTVH